MTLPGINLNEPATDRLHRLLAMVPWLLNRQGVDLEQAAASFGVSTEQLEADLQLLFLCGTPGGLPDDLIDASWEEGRVYLSNADTIARPLRLGVDEALTLIVGLRALAAVPGLGDRDAVDRAIAKLEAAAGSLPGALSDARAVTVDLADQGRCRTSARSARRWRTIVGCTCATSCRRGTRRPSATSTRCGWSRSTGPGISRAGATAPRTCGSSGSTGSRP
ncbi:hypothetical protein GCM10025862_40410 [Arsenicicoccus piscis]|uniref:PafC HTH domain-containing protein n=1 Tax=Arsenicicoccus piscis TaxID=673954 RepID=A0ABQ6HWS0_9MICO|nr:hypothetical protein GCM10025862_17470 [Arsenicicoccus piscis]GMA22020.1 hypothetical protein GCM10025862_40410 [Arsenicicoccus piscis]